MRAIVSGSRFLEVPVMSRKHIFRALAAGVCLLLPVPASWSEETQQAAEPPHIRIAGAERTLLADMSFVSFRCDATNPNDAPVRFVGYAADAFMPPLGKNELGPIYVIELRRDGKWEEHPIGWCGTGIQGVELPGKVSGWFGVALSIALEWEAVRVGIRWSPDPNASIDDPFAVVWSEPFAREQVGADPP
jgi:hypothetical protein